MAIDFPTNPTANQVYTYNGKSWVWNGTAWDLYTSTTFVNTLNGFTGGVTLAAGTYINLTQSNGTITISSPGDGPTGYVASFNGNYGSVQGVSSFNGLTGAVTGVNSIRGLTGAVGITNSSGIGLSVSGQTMTFSNTGVLSINGYTGAVTNFARIDQNNYFATTQTIAANNAVLMVQDLSLLDFFTIDPANNSIYFYDDTVGNNHNLLFPAFALLQYTWNLPAGNVSNITLAGLENTQTFTGTNTFNALSNFSAGISSAGGTFGALTRFTSGISAAGGATFANNAQAATFTETSNNIRVTNNARSWFI